ncbi:MAG TPA: sigma-70 family RNA polymerase sigma factor [Gemmataceae bacterium]|nr:sigma-70 family RNA polymerase sigma factor [Gemmataceae bacterium]
MHESPVTRASLLARLRDPQDADAWRQFVQVYAPVVYGFARKRGLQDADAADLMQNVLRAVVMNAGRLDYDPRRGTFRAWLYTVTRNKLANFLDGRRRQARGSGDTATQERLEAQTAQEDDASALWDREYERQMFAAAAERVRGEFQEGTWRAFWMTAVDGKSAAEAGGALGMSPGAVYVAKSRVLARLRDQVRQWQEE